MIVGDTIRLSLRNDYILRKEKPAVLAERRMPEACVRSFARKSGIGSGAIISGSLVFIVRSIGYLTREDTLDLHAMDAHV